VNQRNDQEPRGPEQGQRPGPLLSGARWRWDRSTVLRWSLVVVVSVACGVFIVTRNDDPTNGFRAGESASVDVVELRQRAALPPCLPAGAAATAASGTLAGVEVPCLDGSGSVDVGAVVAGRPVLINVWSHTCEPCREELPVLQRYAAEPEGIDVLGVQVDGPEKSGLAMLISLGVRMPSVTDPDGKLRAALGAPGVLPLTYIVGSDGSARMVNPPVVFGSTTEVGDTVQRYLAEATDR